MQHVIWCKILICTGNCCADQQPTANDCLLDLANRIALLEKSPAVFQDLETCGKWSFLVESFSLRVQSTLNVSACIHVYEMFHS